MPLLEKPLIIAVVGPTAAGKSAFAVELAKRLGGEVVSADSRQVYRGLDIGSGKIAKREMKGVPHHLLDAADPKRTFTVVDFTKRAEKAIADIARRGKVPIIVGGTGFYVDALLSGAAMPDVPENKTLRKELGRKTPEELFAELCALDPRRAKKIDRHNKVRLIRAIEIARAIGAVPAMRKKKPPYRVLWLGLSMPRDMLRDAIRARLAARLKQGMIAEAKRLHTKGVSLKRLKALGLEYRYAAMHLSGELSRKDMEAVLAVKIYQYAMRQLTWFRRNTEIIWIERSGQHEVRSTE